MTDKEIMQAYEYCVNCDCEDCPNIGVGKCYQIEVAILELAKRQQAEIERMKIAFENSQTATKHWRREAKHNANEIMKLQAEIERLKNDIFCISNERDAWKDTVNTTADEAIKEFTERLKEKTAFYEGWGYITVKKIDNLVKEMVGAE